LSELVSIAHSMSTSPPKLKAGRLLLTGALFLTPPASSAAPAPLHLQAVSAVSEDMAGVSASGDSTEPVLSSDGRLISFLSTAINLVETKRNSRVVDLFARNLQTGETFLLSAIAASASGGNHHSGMARFSADGRFVVFTSLASDLVPGDSNSARDVFLRDLETGLTSLVSVNLEGNASGNGSSQNPFVLFESTASDLVQGDTNGLADLFIRDMKNRETRLVAAAIPVPPQGRTLPFSAVMTPDARYVAYIGGTELYLHDTSSGQTTWVNASGGFTITNAVASGPALSRDGNIVAFKSSLPPLDPSPRLRLIYIDRLAGKTNVIATEGDAMNPLANDLSDVELSFDGRFAAYEQRNPDGTCQICLWDATSQTTEVVTKNMEGNPANSLSRSPMLSDDGRYVTFLSSASDLVTHNAPGAPGTFQLYTRDMQEGVTRLVSMGPDGQACLGGDIGFVSMSADGRYIGFQARGDDLTTGDYNLSYDVYVWDRESGVVELASERMGQSPSATPNASSWLSTYSISGDGRLLVFSSDASNLVPNDTNDITDVFVHDLVEKTTALVSVSLDGSKHGSGPSRNAVISLDGRWVAFESYATNLVGLTDTNRASDIFLRDLHTGVTQLVSVNADGTASGNLASFAPGISADGRFILLGSVASNLVAGVADSNRQMDIFVRDMVAQTTYLVSMGSSADTTDLWGAQSPFMSRDGRYTVFTRRGVYMHDLHARTNRLIRQHMASTARAARFSDDGKWVGVSVDLPVGSEVLLYELASGATSLICTNCSDPSMTSDARFIAYQARVPGPVPSTDIWLYDRDNGSSVLVSVNESGAGPANGPSSKPVISPDGRWVIFQSEASDLVPFDHNQLSDLFARDLFTGKTIRLSNSHNGHHAGDDFSMVPVMSQNGSTAAFVSFASNLNSGDMNSAGDIFAVRLGELFPVAFASSKMRFLPDGPLALSIRAMAGSTVMLEVSHDLQHWSVLHNVPDWPGEGELRDPNPGNSARFYRLRAE
jgi:Tol biopolymer transport system component